MTGQPTAATALNRVPPILLTYWVIKIAATTLGETGADLVSMTLDVGYATTMAVFLAVFGATLWVKLALRGYHPAAYWAVFTASAILGTVISDFIDRTLHLGYVGGSLILVGLLAAVLAWWWRSEGSLSVEDITTSRGEAFYWAAFLVANTLGTAAGDLLADELGFGFLTSAGIIAGVLVLCAVAHYKTEVSDVFLFWVAFVLTRPFGATFGDLLTKTPEHGGLGVGTVGASLVFAAMLVATLWREHVRWNVALER